MSRRKAAAKKEKVAAPVARRPQAEALLPASAVLPWELDPALKRERLVTLAREVAEARNKVFADCEASDTNWGLACRAHERLGNALLRLAGKHPWLCVDREGLYLMPLVEGVPIRPFRGAADRPASRHLDALRATAERNRPRQVAFSFVDALDWDGPWFWLMALETNADGQVVRVTYFQANDVGETRHSWLCPLEDAPGAPPTMQIVARPNSAALPPANGRARRSAAGAPMRNRVSMRVHRVLGFTEVLVPKRIADEELGDAMEIIVRMRQQCHPWLVYLKVATTISGCSSTRSVLPVSAPFRGRPRRRRASSPFERPRPRFADMPQSRRARRPQARGGGRLGRRGGMRRGGPRARRAHVEAVARRRRGPRARRRGGADRRARSPRRGAPSTRWPAPRARVRRRGGHRRRGPRGVDAERWPST